MTAPVTLRRQKEISALFAKGRRKRGRILNIVALQSNDLQRRALFVTSRKVGNAVVRNRVRRRLRAIWSFLQENLPEGLDLAIIALPTTGMASYQELQAELIMLLERLSLLRQG